MLKRTLVVVSAGIAMSGAAMAADVVPTPAPAAFDWSGFYLGGQAQIDMINAHEVTPFNLASATNFGGGISAQRLWQRDKLVFGLVGDVNLLIGDHIAGCIVGGPALQCKFGSSWNASARAKVGFAADKALFYGTAGWGWADVHVSTTTGGVTQHDAITKNGWVAGAGMSYAISPKWSTNLEYLHYDLGSGNISQLISNGTGRLKPTADTITIGVNYKF